MGAPVCFPSQCWDPICLRSVLDLCMLPQSFWVHLCINPVVSTRSCFLGVFHPHWLLTMFFFSSSTEIFEPQGKGFDGDIPFRNEWSKVSHFLPGSGAGLCLLPYCKKLLWWWSAEMPSYGLSCLRLQSGSGWLLPQLFCRYCVPVSCREVNIRDQNCGWRTQLLILIPQLNFKCYSYLS